MVDRAAELAEIDALFARADADHDGQISFAEFRALVRELDEDIPDDELRLGFGEAAPSTRQRLSSVRWGGLVSRHAR